MERMLEAAVGKCKFSDQYLAEKESILGERDQIRTIYDNFKAHYEQIKVEMSTYQKRLGEEMQARKESELQLESRIAEQRRQLQTKQREMEHLANKVHLPVDADMLRLKI